MGNALLDPCREGDEVIDIAGQRPCCRGRTVSADYLDEIVCCKSTPDARQMNNLGPEGASSRNDKLLEVLFTLHDLNNDGFLAEHELVLLNQMIAVLHHGMEADLEQVSRQFSALFRDKFDPDGKPIAFDVFRVYTLWLLDSYDRSPLAQEMMLEQFIAEAQQGRNYCQEVQDMSERRRKSEEDVESLIDDHLAE